MKLRFVAWLRAKRRHRRLLTTGATAGLALASLALAGEQDVHPAKTDPIAYLNQALVEMQTRALRRGAVDWNAVRSEALKRAAHAESTVDTYDAIRFALASLGDHHSSLHPTPELEQLESARRHRAVKDEGKSKLPMSPFVGRYEPEGVQVTANGKRVALVVVTKCFPNNEKEFVSYETKLQEIVAKLDETHPDGWIVDLRGNVGGNMWPMLTGIGPLVGEDDDLGEFFTTSGHSVWRYRDGIASEVEDDGKQNAYPGVHGTPYKVKGTPRVAVLVDHWTGSAGEALAIAFRGRAGTRLFREHTQGVSTANEVFHLPDGAAMWLTVGVDADRTGKQYMNGFDPDEVVKGSEQPVSADKDPVVQQALIWLTRTS